MTTLAAVADLRRHLAACDGEQLAILKRLSHSVRESRSGPSADPVDRAIAATWALLLGEVADAETSADLTAKQARSLMRRAGLD
ncbi:MAG: hypothetical protein ACJ71T_12070 [Actinomycetales bacterium]